MGWNMNYTCMYAVKCRWNYIVMNICLRWLLHFPLISHTYTFLSHRATELWCLVCCSCLCIFSTVCILYCWSPRGLLVAHNLSSFTGWLLISWLPTYFKDVFPEAKVTYDDELIFLSEANYLTPVDPVQIWCCNNRDWLSALSYNSQNQYRWHNENHLDHIYIQKATSVTFHDLSPPI